MPRLNLLRPHRRTATPAPAAPPTANDPPTSARTSSSTSLQLGPRPPPTAISSSANSPTRSSPGTAGNSEDQRSSLPPLPPLDIGSPGLGSIGSWLEHEIPSTTATPAPSNTFSRTSTPYTAITAPTPGITPKPPSVPIPTCAPASLDDDSPPAQSPQRSRHVSHAPPSPSRQTPSPKLRAPALRLATSPPSVPVGKHQPPLKKEKDQSTMKLARLNPIALLRRRSSQSQPKAKKEKGRDAYIEGVTIKGTRHPDWDSRPSAGRRPTDDNRTLSPIPVEWANGKKSYDMGRASMENRRRHSRTPSTGMVVGSSGSAASGRGMGIISAGALSSPASPAQQTLDPLAIPVTIPGTAVSEENMVETTISMPEDALPPQARSPLSPQTPISPSFVNPSNDVDTDNEGELHSSPYDLRPRVTLTDHPLSLPHHVDNNSSRFSFEGSGSDSPTGEGDSQALGSSSSQAPPSTMRPSVDYDDEDDEDGFQFDLDDFDGEDDGFERANEGMFDMPNPIQPLNKVKENQQSQLNALQAAVMAMNIGREQQQQNGVIIGTAVSAADNLNSRGSLEPPRPISTDVGASTEEDSEADSDATGRSKSVLLAGRKRLEHIANPRNLDLSDDDLDFIHEDSGLTGYENEGDDDDMYFDDGIISRVLPQDHPNGLPSPPPTTVPLSPLPLNMQAATLSPVSPLSPGSPEVPAQLDPRRYSTLAQDGSIAPGTEPLYEPHAFPPFMNPVGGGFYPPNNMSNNLLNNFTLDSLTSSLAALQQQQAALPSLNRLSTATADSAPEISPTPTSPPYPTNLPLSLSSRYHEDDGFGDDDGFDYSTLYDDPEDPSIIAAANAAALGADQDGFYGSEFGFFPSSNPQGSASGLGGFFVNTSAAVGPIRPSLTPISERSEGSYRNSMVFPVAGWGHSPGVTNSWQSNGGGGTPGWNNGIEVMGLGELARAEEQRERAGDGEHLEREEEMEQLRKMRRSFGGPGLGGNRRNSTSGASSPVASSPIVESENEDDEEDDGQYGYDEVGGEYTHSPMTQQQQMGGVGWGNGIVAGLGGLPPGLIGGMPPGIGTSAGGGGGGPPGLRHPGSKAMLPTKGSFEEGVATAGAVGMATVG